MRSVKPGRAPSFMGGIGAIGACAFGVFWTVMANRIGAPGFMTVFGVFFTVLSAGSAVYQFRNATSRNRFSEYDITDSREEPDPLDRRFDGAIPDPDDAGEFCPFCGARLGEGFLFCRKCGKKMPE